MNEAARPIDAEETPIAPRAPFTPDPALYPFPRRYLRLPSGLDYHYVDEGSGDPVIMVHGNPTWSFYYRALILQLRDRYRVMAPDHIGCGLSSRPTLDQYPFTLEQRVADLEAWIESRELDPTVPVTLVLHDWGGMIGMAWAARHPERVGRLVVLNTAAFPKPPTKRLPRSLKLGRDLWLGAFLIKRFNLFSRLANSWATTRGLAPEVCRHYSGASDDPGGRLSTLRFVQDIPLSEADPGYSIVKETEAKLALFRKHPALIAWGRKDFVFDRHFLDHWRAHLPQARVLDYPGAGHYVLEDEATLLIPEIERFLDESSAYTGER